MGRASVGDDLVTRRAAVGRLTAASGFWAVLAADVAVAEDVSMRPAAAGQPGVLNVEFLYDTAPFPSCHASTIVESASGLVAAWFGGSDEGNDDVSIWVSRREAAGWSFPAEAADGVDTDGRRYPCWNPVLFRADGGDLLLFYKVGPSPSRWWGLWKRSTDGGKSWSAFRHLPLGVFGPIRNKPARLPEGTLLCGSSTEHDGWRVHMERSTADLSHWEKTPPLNDGAQLGLIQPTILTHADGRLQILCRSRQRKIYGLWSADGGRTWTDPQALDLPNPNSGIDGLTLADGRHLLVYNHTEKGRTPLNVALSADGRRWQPAVVLENAAGEFSYPAVIQAQDGTLHITYTWNRSRIRHVALDPARL